MTSPACRGPQCVLYQVSDIRYQGFVQYLLIFHPIRRVSVWAPHQNLVSNDGVQNAHTYSVLLSAISAIHRCCMRMLRVVVRSRSALFAMTLMRAGVGVDEVDANFRSGICLPRFCVPRTYSEIALTKVRSHPLLASSSRSGRMRSAREAFFSHGEYTSTSPLLSIGPCLAYRPQHDY